MSQSDGTGRTLEDLLAQEEPQLRWLAPEENPWSAPVLDVRGVTQRLISTTKNPDCVRNALSMTTEDGASFVGATPPSGRRVPSELAYAIDGFLASGVLFAPQCMEHKWGIFLLGGQIVFVRSWQREVRVVADVEITANSLRIRALTGAFAEDEPSWFTERVVDFLMRTHALGAIHPAPLLSEEESLEATARECFSGFGSLALFATPHDPTPLPIETPLRSDSLLHIAVAREGLDAAARELERGVPIDLLARDGLSPLHWSVASESTAAAAWLLERRASVDARSLDGATPLMTAVQLGRSAHARLLLARGADPNARDSRGFTALHRAAELGESVLVAELLDRGADPGIEAAGYTARALAAARDRAEVLELLCTTK